MNFTNGAELVSLCERNGSTVAREMLARESELSGLPEEKLRARMAESYGVMKQAVQRSLRQVSDTMGGLIGGEAQKLYLHRQTGRSVCGPILSRAVTYAMGTLEVSASMGLIVAAPTAGSAGVIPGVFLAVQEEFGFSDGQMVDALFHAGAVGYLIMRNATISGAEGGCQAEVGSAGAMAASAVAALMGEKPARTLDAAALALGNVIGLVCDPIGGLVEAPCQSRNAMGAANALVAAELVLSGVPCIVPFDEMVEVMYRTGRSLPSELRETALGGCAAAPSACSRCAGC